MKLVSTKTYEGKRLHWVAPFNLAFVHELKLSDNNIYTFEYDFESLKTRFPTNIANAYFVVKLTDCDIFAWANVEIEDVEDEHALEFLDYFGTGLGDIEFEAFLNSIDKQKLLLYIIQNLLKS